MMRSGRGETVRWVLAGAMVTMLAGCGGTALGEGPRVAVKPAAGKVPAVGAIDKVMAEYVAKL